MSPDLIPPPIAPVTGEAPRPLWSVMIPTFNCANYLRKTLSSVLAQAPEPEQMQIEVVDDVSTKDDPETVVREMGQGRVQFFRKPRNEGAIRNFNTCITRSRGELVHILHGDDYVLPDFYKKLAAAAQARRDLAFFACRSLLIDDEGIVFDVSQRVKSLEIGGRNTDEYLYSNPTQTPGVVVRRSFYEQKGGFLLPLFHTADCEMWTRAISCGGGLVLPDVLCCYRVFAANDSGRLARMADNLRDMQRLHELFRQRHEGFDPSKANALLAQVSARQIERFRRNKDCEALAANLAFWRQSIPFNQRARARLLKLARALFR